MSIDWIKSLKSKLKSKKDQKGVWTKTANSTEEGLSFISPREHINICDDGEVYCYAYGEEEESDK